MESEIRTSDHDRSNFERFWSLFIFHVFVIFCFSLMTNSKTVKPEKRDWCLPSARKGVLRRGVWDVMSYAQPFLDKRIPGLRGWWQPPQDQGSSLLSRKGKWQGAARGWTGRGSTRVFPIFLCILSLVLKFRGKKPLINSNNFSFE